MSKTIEELEKEIEELREEIKQYKENKTENKRWRAERGDTYYHICTDAEILIESEEETDFDNDCYEIGNYFQTKEQAKKVVEKIKIYTQLKDLALRLNNGNRIDWQELFQQKYYIYLYKDKICTTCICATREIGQVYCLDDSFLDKALEEIGEENLKKLFEED